MGQMDVARLDPTELRTFITALLGDVRALERMLVADMIESGQHRIGCEQEMFLVDRAYKPFPIAIELLARLDDPDFATELGRFNLETGVAPRQFEGDCLSQTERDLDAKLSRARAAAHAMHAEVVLTGILPTLRTSDLGLDNLTPKQRYRGLNDAMTELSGGAFEFRLRGADELILRHDSVMLEACCTSFQVHYQAEPKDVINQYNVAQAITAPILAAAVNSPLLFGRRLWMETRIPLFQQGIDTRRASSSLRERSSRVSFGHRWLERSVVELFQEDIARFRVLLGRRTNDDSMRALRQGRVPTLKALQVHNGTIYRWNRICYGLTDGKPHLRIENRVLPAGPTVLDEVANAAFFWGLMSGMPRLYPDITRVLDFDDAQLNFIAAAESGLQARFRWIGGRTLTAQQLILDELLPIARDGLSTAGVRREDVTRYLGVIEARVANERTGADWLLRSLAEVPPARRHRALTDLTSELIERQWTNPRGVHEWEPAKGGGYGRMKSHELRVEEAMSTDLVTVEAEESIDLVASLMEWKRVRHVPVEDRQGRLVGLMSTFEVLGHCNRRRDEDGAPRPVREVMNPSPATVAPETTLADAVTRMRGHKAECLLVVKDDRLVGLVTEHDILDVLGDLLNNTGSSTGPGVNDG
jgi:CBS domain-containing protein